MEFLLLHDVSRDDKNEKRIGQLGSILRCCSSLTALHLTNVLFDVEMIEILAQMKNLRSLGLEVVYSGTKMSSLEYMNDLCREENMSFDEELPPLESLHFSPQLRSYSYDRLISAVNSSLKELSIHRSTASLRWTHKLVSSGLDLELANDYFPCIERLFIWRMAISLDLSSDPSGSILPFLRRHRETLKEFTILGQPPFFQISVPILKRIMRFMAGEDIIVLEQHEGLMKEEIVPVNGFSAIFGEWLASNVEGRRRPVVELGVSLGEARMDLESVEYDFPMSDLGALLDHECFDQVELIALDTIDKHAFFFSEFIVRIICDSSRII